MKSSPLLIYVRPMSGRFLSNEWPMSVGCREGKLMQDGTCKHVRSCARRGSFSQGVGSGK